MVSSGAAGAGRSESGGLVGLAGLAELDGLAESGGLALGLGVFWSGELAFGLGMFGLGWFATCPGKGTVAMPTGTLTAGSALGTRNAIGCCGLGLAATTAARATATATARASSGRADGERRIAATRLLLHAAAGGMIAVAMVTTTDLGGNE